jgi:hypothetical protein
MRFFDGSSTKPALSTKLAKYISKNNVLQVDLRSVRAHNLAKEQAMTENIKLPRKLSEEQKQPPPRRPSHADVIENLDRWANSPGLQPPNSSEDKTA